MRKTVQVGLIDAQSGYELLQAMPMSHLWRGALRVGRETIWASVAFFPVLRRDRSGEGTERTKMLILSNTRTHVSDNRKNFNNI